MEEEEEGEEKGEEEAEKKLDNLQHVRRPAFYFTCWIPHSHVSSRWLTIDNDDDFRRRIAIIILSSDICSFRARIPASCQ